jgi:recombinational DNA repair protein RecR
LDVGLRQFVAILLRVDKFQPPLYFEQYMSQWFDNLRTALKKLPSTGTKSAERMALYLALEDQTSARDIAQTILSALEHITPCPECGGCLHWDGDLWECSNCDYSEED